MPKIHHTQLRYILTVCFRMNLSDYNAFSFKAINLVNVNHRTCCRCGDKDLFMLEEFYDTN